MKKFKVIGCIVALLALVTANVWNAATVVKASELDISNVETIAEGDVNGVDATDKRKNKVEQEQDCEVKVTVVFYTNGDYEVIEGLACLVYMENVSDYFYDTRPGVKIVCVGQVPNSTCAHVSCHRRS